jgi:hypothetical protein
VLLAYCFSYYLIIIRVRTSFIIRRVELATELEASLRNLSSAPSVEERENGGRVAVFASLSWEMRGARQKPLLHLWSERHYLTRWVLAITDQTERRLTLAVEHSGRNKPDRLEFLRMEFERSSRVVSREEACARLARILTEQFPDEKLESLTAAQDLEHSLSGCLCARLVAKWLYTLGCSRRTDRRIGRASRSRIDICIAVAR